MFHRRAGARLEVELIKAIWNMLSNKVAEDVLEESALRVGPPRFSEKDFEFAREIAKSFNPGQVEAQLRKEDVPEEVFSQVLNTTWLPRPTTPKDGEGSTDISDASWCCPTAEFRVACQATGTPGHSWQFTAQSGMSIGHDGMITAGKILAEAGFEFATNPSLVEQAKAEFVKSTGRKMYQSAIPKDHKPKFDQFAKHD